MVLIDMLRQGADTAISEGGMPYDNSFGELMQRVRAGDQEAASELVRRYEPAIRRTIRVRLRDPRLGRLLDSMDICQSVLASFFVRAALGQYELQQPEHLLKLLTRMARNKLANQAHHHRALCRDYRRNDATANLEMVADGEGSKQPLDERELLSEARRRLSDEERRLLELRQQGLEWSEIAQRLNASADALRMRLARAVERVAEELKLDAVPHE